jgi:hypothetical protein
MPLIRKGIILLNSARHRANSVQIQPKKHPKRATREFEHQNSAISASQQEIQHQSAAYDITD